mmetsp:Transcript_56050/g.164580  ORF Transcript_56050/g.164580 Transcript_56050/m.164580 type:complete len:244 (+) Transcript_56050:1056-1787(+)
MSSFRFMFRSFVSPEPCIWSCAKSMLERESWRMILRSVLGLSARSTESEPSGLQITFTHWPASSDSMRAVMSGSKQVASSTPELRARTAQCDRMSGAEAASLTSTAWTPTGTSSSPLTMPLRKIVGVSKIRCSIPTMRSMTFSSPWTGRSTAEIICQGGRCAMPRSCGSSRLSTRLTEKSALPRRISSTKKSRTCLSVPTAWPMCWALGPIRFWNMSTCSPTTRVRRSTMDLSRSALSTALLL